MARPADGETSCRNPAYARPRISVVIPIAETETETPALLALLPDDLEVIQERGGTRAECLNRGAARARGDFLWFLHADSTVTTAGVAALRNAIEGFPERLHYFDLAFTRPRPIWMALNECGVRFRSRVLGCPYGDQGLCLSRGAFDSAGRFPEDVAFGEDHVFVWRARQAGIALNPVGATLGTSARRYARDGWLVTTLRFQILWFRQAYPEWRKLRESARRRKR